MHLDDHLHRLEGHVADADKAPEALVEHRRDLVDDERGERRRYGDEIAATVPRASCQEEHRGAGDGKKAKKGRELGRRLEEHAGKEAAGHGEPVVAQRVAG